MINPGTWQRGVLAVLTCMGLTPASAAGQSSDVPPAVGGAALGGLAGTTVGTLGAIVPCNDTYAGPHCVRWVAAGAGVVGAVAGAVVGAADRDELGDAALGGAIGFGVGTAVGFALMPFIERWAVQDAVALGLVGGAAGTAPIGGAIGFGAGALVGAVLWPTVPGFGSPRAAGCALAGLAIGVLTEWVVRAASAEGAQPIAVGVHVPF